MPTINPVVDNENRGAFRPGYDPRRVVAPKRKITKAIEELCKEHAELAVATLAGLIADTEIEAETRRKACNDLLDRAYGKAVDRVAIKQVGGDANADARLLTTDQIIALLTPAALESTPQEACQENNSSECATLESIYIVVGDSEPGSEDVQSADDAEDQCDAPGAWPWSDTEEEAAIGQQGDAVRSDTTPVGDLK